MSKIVAKIVALVVGGRTYHYRVARNNEWERIPRRKLGKLLPEMVTTVRLRRKVEVTVEVKEIGTIRVHLRLNPDYHLHARWFAGDETENQNLDRLVEHEVRRWAKRALRKRGQRDPEGFIAELSPGGMSLPGNIYRAIKIELDAGHG